MKNMRGGPERGGKAPRDWAEAGVLISGDGVKRMVFDRIGEPRRSRLRRHDHHG